MARPKKTPDDSPPPPPGVSTKQRAEADYENARARRELAVAERWPEREIAALMALEGSKLKLLAKLSGDIEITQGQIIRHPEFRRVMGYIANVLEKYPVALKAVSEELTRINGGEKYLK